jgi:putative Ca2+/H+ antiporter (TMEM165/GDT1 family)
VTWRDQVCWCALAYWTVLAAELIGDRSIYTIASLALRFRPLVVYGGITAAFMGKMLVAVLCGRLLAHLPLAWTSAISAATFFATAICIWLKRRVSPRPEPEPALSWRGAAGVSFVAVFFSEWADFGQLSAAALAVRSNAAAAVWLGGSLALCTKGALAITVGMNLRGRISDYFARSLSTASCFILGVMSLRELFSR